MQTKGLLNYPSINTRSAGIDLLRAGLALWVLFSHLIPEAKIFHSVNILIRIFVGALTFLFQSHHETHPAVLGFIVLSGYCIHRAGARASGFNIRAYTVRRFFRIVPVYFFAIVLGIICFSIATYINSEKAIFLFATNEITLKGVLVKLLGVAAFLPSFHAVSVQGNAPLGTVMVEIWLYVFYATAMSFLLKGKEEKKLWISLFLAWASFLFWVSQNPTYLNWWHNGSFFSFCLYWWIGAAFVGESFQSTFKSKKSAFVLGWVGLTLLLVLPAEPSHALTLMRGGSFFEIGNLPKAFDAMPYVLFAIESKKILFALIFGNFIVFLDKESFVLFERLGFIGKAGYSIYAIHAPLLILFLLLGFSWWVTAVLTILSGSLLFKMYEDPFIRFGKESLMRRKLIIN